MTINLSALAPATTAATALSNLVLVSPQSVQGYQPQNPPTNDGKPSTAVRPASFLFDYEGEQTVSLESDITDHYVEDNTAVQDQIALKPEVITTHGFIGELNDVAPFGLQTLKAAANRLTTVGAYVPALTINAQIAYNEAFLAYQVVANALHSAVSAWSSLTGGDQQNEQQKAFQQFYGFWRNRTLFTVQTPWAIFEDMAISKVRAVQDAETRVITDFELTFKKIRTASTKTSIIATSTDGRLNSQSSEVESGGTVSPPNSIGLSSGISSMVA